MKWKRLRFPLRNPKPSRPSTSHVRTQPRRRLHSPAGAEKEEGLQTIDALGHRLSSYLEPSQIDEVRRAYYYAEQAHDGQYRRSGEPYITHPLAVANILSAIHMDHQSLVA